MQMLHLAGSIQTCSPNAVGFLDMIPGRMIAYDNTACSIKRLHYSCVIITHVLVLKVPLKENGTALIVGKCI